eukprot:PhF_6_TR8260/c0_g1_i1/m.12563
MSDKSKFADGINQPTSVTQGTSGAKSRVFYNNSTPPQTIRDLIATLSPAMFPPHIVNKLLSDLEKYQPQLQRGVEKYKWKGFTLQDAEALFVYTYEMYEPDDTPVETIPPKKLIKVLRHLGVHEKCLSQIEAMNLDGAAIMDQRNSSVDISDDKIRAWFPMEGDALSIIRARDMLRAAKVVCLADYDCGTNHSNQVYGLMNRTMRETNDEVFRQAIDTWSPWIQCFNIALMKLPPVEKPKEVFRGVNVEFDYDKYSPGNYFFWPAFSSTSASKKVGKQFARGGSGHGTLFIATVNTGRNISEFSKFPEEEEYLLAPNTFFVVKQGMTRTMMEMAECEQIIVLEEVKQPGSSVLDVLSCQPNARYFWNVHFGFQTQVPWHAFEKAQLESLKGQAKALWEDLRMSRHESPQYAAAYGRMVEAFSYRGVSDPELANVTITSFRHFLKCYEWMGSVVIVQPMTSSGKNLERYTAGDTGHVVRVDIAGDEIDLFVQFDGHNRLHIPENAVYRELAAPTEFPPGDSLAKRFRFSAGELVEFGRGPHKGMMATIASYNRKTKAIVVDFFDQPGVELEGISTYAELMVRHRPIRLPVIVSTKRTCGVDYPAQVLNLLRRILRGLLLEPSSSDPVCISDARTMTVGLNAEPNAVVTLTPMSSCWGYVWQPTVAGLMLSQADGGTWVLSYMQQAVAAYCADVKTHGPFLGAYPCVLNTINLGDAVEGPDWGFLLKSPIDVETNSFFFYGMETAMLLTKEKLSILGLLVDWSSNPILTLGRVAIDSEHPTFGVTPDTVFKEVEDMKGHVYRASFKPLFFTQETMSRSWFLNFIDVIRGFYITKKPTYFKKHEFRHGRLGVEEQTDELALSYTTLEADDTNPILQSDSSHSSINGGMEQPMLEIRSALTALKDTANPYCRVDPERLLSMLILPTISWHVVQSCQNYPTLGIVQCNAPVPADVRGEVSLVGKSEKVEFLIECGTMESLRFKLPAEPKSVMASDSYCHQLHKPQNTANAQCGTHYLQQIELKRTTSMCVFLPYLVIPRIMQACLYSQYAAHINAVIFGLAPLFLIVAIALASAAWVPQYWWIATFLSCYMPSLVCMAYLTRNKEKIYHNMVEICQKGIRRDPMIIVLNLTGFFIPKVLGDICSITYHKQFDQTCNPSLFIFAMVLFSLSVIISMYGMFLSIMVFIVANRTTYMSTQKFLSATVTYPELLTQPDTYLRKYISLSNRVTQMRLAFMEVVHAMLMSVMYLFIIHTIGFLFELVNSHWNLSSTFSQFDLTAPSILAVRPAVVLGLWSVSTISCLLETWQTLPEEMAHVICNRLEYLSRIPDFSSSKYRELLSYVRTQYPLHWSIFAHSRVQSDRIRTVVFTLVFFIALFPSELKDMFVQAPPPPAQPQPSPNTPLMYQWGDPSNTCSIPLPTPLTNATASSSTISILYPNNYLVPIHNASVTCKVSSSCCGLRLVRSQGVYTVGVDVTSSSYASWYKNVTTEGDAGGVMKYPLVFNCSHDGRAGEIVLKVNC